MKALRLTKLGVFCRETYITIPPFRKINNSPVYLFSTSIVRRKMNRFKMSAFETMPSKCQLETMFSLLYI